MIEKILGWLHRCPSCGHRPYRRTKTTPRWVDDPTAQMLGVAQFGCPDCGQGAIAERDAQPREVRNPYGDSTPPDIENWEKRYFYEWCPLILCPHMQNGQNTARGHWHWFRKNAPTYGGS